MRVQAGLELYIYNIAMPCYSPLQAFRAYNRDKSKTTISFRSQDRGALPNNKLALPCGQCIGCKLERSRQWAVRCMHEASLYEDNSFLTLTYDNDNIPKDGSLHLEHFQNFMKRLRKQNAPKKIRFFHCGEYGDRFFRPHYHTLLFNHSFSDRKAFSGKPPNTIYTSNTLSALWPYGFSVIGEVTFESAAYVARYVLKKVTGEKAEAHYAGRKPEYITMSRRPGIGKEWIKKFNGDVYPHDRVIVRGVSTRPPRFYDDQLQKSDPALMALLKMERSKNEKYVTDTLSNGKVVVESDSSLRRLAVKEEVKKAQLKNLIRPLEGSSYGY